MCFACTVWILPILGITAATDKLGDLLVGLKWSYSDTLTTPYRLTSGRSQHFSCRLLCRLWAAATVPMVTVNDVGTRHHRIPNRLSRRNALWLNEAGIKACKTFCIFKTVQRFDCLHIPNRTQQKPLEQPIICYKLQLFGWQLALYLQIHDMIRYDIDNETQEVNHYGSQSNV